MPGGWMERRLNDAAGAIRSDDDPNVGLWLDAQLTGGPVPPLLVVIGLGQGRLLDAIENRAPATRVLALEPEPRVAEAFWSCRDWSRWFESGRLIYLVDPDYAGADDAWRMFPDGPDAYKLLVDPALAREGSPGAVRAAQVVKRIVFGVRANAAARRAFAPRYLVNSIHNLPALVAGSDVRALTDFYRGVPVVIAAAGPALDTVIDDLRATADRAVLIAADTALRPLLDAGLAPQLVVGLDPGEANARHFLVLPSCADTWLVSESALDRSAADRFYGRTFWFRVANHHPWPWYGELGIDVGTIDVWGSVLTAAFQVAVLAGCDPIVLVGADFAFTNGRPYCRGTTYEFDWARSTAHGHDLGTVWRQQMARSDQMHVPDVRGARTVTAPHLQSFRDWMVSRAARSGRRVVNATGAGIFLGGGVEQLSLSAALPVPCAIPSLKTIRRLAPTAAPQSKLASRLRDARRMLAAGAVLTPPVAPWAAFCGDGYDPTAIGVALDAAERGLDAGNAEPLELAPAIAWTQLARSDVSRTILTQLPEAIGWLRKALNGGEAPLPIASTAVFAGPVDREALLVQAFDLLGRISAVAMQAEDLATPLNGDWVGRMPVSSLGAWPENLRWSAQVFEALLGMAWTSPLPSEESSFFSRPVLPRDCSTIPEAPAWSASEHPNTSEACAWLAIEWVLCTAVLADMPAAEFGCFVGRMRGIAAAIRPADAADARESGAALVIGAKAGDWTGAVELPLTAGERALARVLTGTVQAPPSMLLSLARVDTPGLAATIRVRLAATVRQGDVARGAREPRPLRLTPRVLTDEGVARSVVSYADARGAVVVPLHGLTSHLLREDGSSEPHRSWPHPIIGELPMGPRGVVAWSNGSTSWSLAETGYVMHRIRADGPVTVEELPFRPTMGAWWRGRLYWACFPSGVGSWAPGEGAAFSLPDLSLCAVQADEAGLSLDPCVRDAEGALLRRLATHAWKWRIDCVPEKVAVGAYGAASCRSTAEGWTAVAYPEADVVRLESGDGRGVVMTCYYPFRVAWAGRSLLVGTIDGELLLFERLIDVLDHDRGSV